MGQKKKQEDTKPKINAKDLRIKANKVRRKEKEARKQERDKLKREHGVPRGQARFLRRKPKQQAYANGAVPLAEAA